MAATYDEEALLTWVEHAGGYARGGDGPSKALRTVVHEVNVAYSGQPHNLVDSQLRQRFASVGLPIKQPAFDEIVALISDGSLSG